MTKPILHHHHRRWHFHLLLIIRRTIHHHRPPRNPPRVYFQQQPSKPFNQPIQPPPPRRRSRSPILPILLTTLSYIPLYIFFRNHVGQILSVNGSSMTPILSPDYTSTGSKDRVWGWSHGAGYRFLRRKTKNNNNNNDEKRIDYKHPFGRGMIVAFWSPLDEQKLVVKRVVGLEGDLVRLRRSKEEGEDGVEVEVDIPPGHVWVEGDEGVHSRDSNLYGPISVNLIVARITYVVWPLWRMGRINWEDWRPREGIVIGGSQKTWEEFR